MLFLPFVALSQGRRSLCTHGTRRWWSWWWSWDVGPRAPSALIDVGRFQCWKQVPKKITKGFPPVALSQGRRSLSHARHPAVVVVVVDDDSSPTAPPILGSRVPPAPAPASRSPGPSRDQGCYMPPDLIHTDTDTCICMYHVNNNPARGTIGETKKARERKQVSPEVAEWSTGLAEQARRLPPLRRHPDQRRRTLPLARGDHAGPWTLAPPPRREEKKRWHAGRGLDWTRRDGGTALPRPDPPRRPADAPRSATRRTPRPRPA